MAADILICRLYSELGPILPDSKDGVGTVKPAKHCIKYAYVGNHPSLSRHYLDKTCVQKQNPNLPTFKFVGKDAKSFSGTNMATFADPANPGKRYLLISEGATCKIRMIDITNITVPSTAKVSTLTSVVGPREVAVDSSTSKLYVIDMGGQLNQIDLAPNLPCG